MNEEKFSALEKDVAILKVVVEPLCDDIKENTKTNRETQTAILGLTHEIKDLVSLHRKQSEDIRSHNERILYLEKKEAVREAASDVKTFAIRAIVGTMVAGCGGFLWYLITLYAQTK